MTKLAELTLCVRGAVAMKCHLGDWKAVTVDEFFQRVRYADFRMTSNVGSKTMSNIIELLREVSPEKTELWLKGSIPTKDDTEKEAIRKVSARLGRLETLLSETLVEMKTLAAIVGRYENKR